MPSNIHDLTPDQILIAMAFTVAWALLSAGLVIWIIDTWADNSKRRIRRYDGGRHER